MKSLSLSIHELNQSKRSLDTSLQRILKYADGSERFNADLTHRDLREMLELSITNDYENFNFSLAGYEFESRNRYVSKPGGIELEALVIDIYQVGKADSKELALAELRITGKGVRASHTSELLELNDDSIIEKIFTSVILQILASDLFADRS